MNALTRRALLLAVCLLAMAAPRGRAAPAEEEDFYTRFWPTTSLPRTSVLLSSKLNETVSAVNVEEGQRVAEDVVLVRFDGRLVRARIAMAETEADFAARIESAQKSYEFYRREHQRLSELRAGVDISESELHRARLQMETARLELAELKRAAELAERRLAYYRAEALNYEVRSPIDGVVSHVWVEPGEMTEVAQPLLEVIDPNLIEVRVQLDESYAPNVAPGQGAVVEFPAAGERQFDGRVRVVSPYVDSSSGFFVVKVLVEPDSDQVKPGMACRVRFEPFPAP